MSDNEPIRFRPDSQCRRDLDPNDERSEMWWSRLQKRHADIFPPKVKIGRINHRKADLWEAFKRELIMMAASAKPDPKDTHNLERGRVTGRAVKRANDKAREKKERPKRDALRHIAADEAREKPGCK